MYSTKWADIAAHAFGHEYKELPPILQGIAEAAESLRLAADDLYIVANKGRDLIPDMYERLGMTQLLIHQLWQQTEQMADDTEKMLEPAELEPPRKLRE